MSQAASPVPPIVKSVRVARPAAEAFHAFTAEIGAWWPHKTHALGAGKVASITMEGRKGGRVYETWEDGTQKHWGTITVWEPPHRLAFTWHVSVPPEQASLVSLTFVPDSEATLVYLEHTQWERLGPAGRAVRENYEMGWNSVFAQCYARHAAARPIALTASYGHPPFLQGAVRDLSALWAAEELGAAYRLIWINTKEGEQRAAENRARMPFGKIPSLTHGDFTLFESAAMVTYLCEVYGSYLPPARSVERALYDQWCFAAVNTLEPPLLEVFAADVFGDGSPEAQARRAQYAEVAKTRLAALDGVLEGKDFILGERFTGADIVLGHVLGFARDESLFAQAPRALAYRTRLFERPAYQRALSIQGRGPG